VTSFIALDFSLYAVTCFKVAVEVHDVEFRLSRICGLLKRHGFEVYTEQQQTNWHDGMLICVPEALRLYYVYASRKTSPAHANTTQ